VGDADVSAVVEPVDSDGAIPSPAFDTLETAARG
jgi:hypothetical protein